VEAKIVDTETGTREVPTGEAGELLVRGPNLMDGYYEHPDETALVLQDGWLHTGDIATVDAEGYFAIVDRKRELIIVSGYNVYPREVEEALFAHPAVLEAAAIGIPDEEKGEVVKAFVVLKPGADATGEQLIAHCRESLARFKVHGVDCLPQRAAEITHRQGPPPAARRRGPCGSRQSRRGGGEVDRPLSGRGRSVIPVSAV